MGGARGAVAGAADTAARCTRRGPHDVLWRRVEAHVQHRLDRAVRSGADLTSRPTASSSTAEKSCCCQCTRVAGAAPGGRCCGGRTQAEIGQGRPGGDRRPCPAVSLARCGYHRQRSVASRRGGSSCTRWQPTCSRATSSMSTARPRLRFLLIEVGTRYVRVLGMIAPGRRVDRAAGQKSADGFR